MLRQIKSDYRKDKNLAYKVSFDVFILMLAILWFPFYVPAEFWARSEETIIVNATLNLFQFCWLWLFNSYKMVRNFNVMYTCHVAPTHAHVTILT